MKATALLGQSFRSIYSNKARSTLTILGIVIGIASVIALVSLGNGLKEQVTTNVAGLGAKDISIRSQDPTRETATREGSNQGGPGGNGGPGGFVFGGEETQTITQADYDYIKSNNNIAYTSVDMNTRLDVTLSADATEATAYQVHGVDVDYFKLKDLTTSSGNLFTKSQIDDSAATVVLGAGAAKDIFPDNPDPVGQTFYIKDTAYVVGAVLAESDSESVNINPMDNPTDAIYMGYKNYMTLNEVTAFSNVTAQAKTEDSVASAKEEILAKLLKNHEITDDSKADVAINTSADLLETRSSIAESFTSTLTGVAAISLIVGGIGIMNIMLVTVTERTREIGLRRAIGAKNRHILLQFLSESLLLTMIGGALGVGVGVITSKYSSSLLSFLPTRGPGSTESNIQAIVSPSTLIMATAISAGIGIVFGLFPAWKASRLDPVEALRFE
jgi:putative ABC transport system permease protein